MITLLIKALEWLLEHLKINKVPMPQENNEQPTTVKEAPVPDIAGIISRKERLYEVAKACLGRDASPSDAAPDEYGCMETVDEIYKKAFGVYINGSKDRPTLSTLSGYEVMKRNYLFKEINKKDADFGDILVYATGTSTNPNTVISNGHVFVVAKYGLLSNDSLTGKFMENYTLQSAAMRYELNGGYPPHVFRLI